MEGQVAMVTGGASGIGRAFVDLLLSRKVKVCIADVNAETASSTIQDLTGCYKDAQLLFQQCDVSDEKQIENAIKTTIDKYGRIDILINNAGISNQSIYREMIAINVNGVINGTMLGLKYLSKTTGGAGGCIINMSSLAGLLSVPLYPVYAATKHAVIGFTRSIGAISLSKHGVRINCLCPSFVETSLAYESTHKVECCFGTKEELDEYIAEVSKQTKAMKCEGVAECLATFLDDTTLTGVAMLCSAEYPQAIIKMPDSVKEAYDFYIPDKK